MRHKLLTVQFIFSLALVVAVSVIPAIAQWNEPPEGTVAPANNAPAPINVGASTQSKEGNLVLNAGGIFASGLLVPRGDITVGNPVNDATMGASAKVKAFGNVWADKYCDRDGGNCYTSTEMAGGGGGAIRWVLVPPGTDPNITITIPDGVTRLVISPTAFVSCPSLSDSADTGIMVGARFKAEGKMYAELKIGATGEDNGTVEIQSSTSGTFAVTPRSQVVLTGEKMNRRGKTGTITTAAWSAALNCPSGTAMTAEFKGYTILGF